MSFYHFFVPPLGCPEKATARFGRLWSNIWPTARFSRFWNKILPTVGAVAH